MGSASSLRNELYLQAAATALYGLARPDGRVWTALTMAVAAGAVFLGAAVQPTAALRTAVLAFEGVAVTVGLVGVLTGHAVPGTLLGLVVLVQLAGRGSRSPSPALEGYGVPVASPFDYPAAPAAHVAAVPDVPDVAGVPGFVAPTAQPTMTILPG